MVILHTCWRNDRLYVWGEQEASEEGVLSERPSERCHVSPFDPGREALRTALTRVTRELEIPDSGAEHVALLLPTRRTKRGACPVPSHAFLSQAVASAREDEQAVLFQPWAVSALALAWKPAFTLFGQCKETKLAAEVFAGEDLLSFAELFRYAGALVARGRFLPDIRKDSSGSHEARWRPSIDREEHRRLAKLAQRLPPCACCGAPQQEVAEAFLEEIVDRLVRVSVVTTLSRAQAERGKHYSAHDAWFSALRGDARAIRWPSASDLDELLGQLAAWGRPVEGGRTRDEHVALCLREPVSPEQPWFLQVAFSLSPQDRLTENMLLSLGQATALFPPLGCADSYPEGLGCPLSTAEAHAFLTVSSPLLLGAGFEVRLPSWWPQGALQALTVEADVSPHQQASEDPRDARNERVDIRWSVSLNGRPVTSAELAGLLSAQTPLVFFRGQWIQVDARQIQNALRIGTTRASETQPALEAVRWALGTGSGHHGLNVSAVRSSGWMEPLLKRLCGDQTVELLSAPSAFCGELRPYQTRGFSWLVYLRSWGFGACLADDMGLGKTIQALAFLLHEQARGEPRPVLLVGPMSVLGNWVKEAQRFAPSLRFLLHHGAERCHGDSLLAEAARANVVLTSYNLLYRDYADLRKITWAGILLDEAQNIKNPDTQQAQAARALQADYRIALTGTPMENNVGDVWSIMDFINPGMLGKRSVFREKFFRPIQSGTDPGARTRLRRVTTPFIMRRLKTDKQIIADLPEKVEGKVYCPLTLEQAQLYKEVLDNFQREVDSAEGIGRRGLILAVLTRLKQVCNHPVHYLGKGRAAARRSGKLMRLEEMLEESFARGESALVFTQYAEMGALLKKELCQTFARDMPFLHGGVPRKARDRMVQAYQETEQPVAFILSLKAGGTGLNLTRASHVFHYDRWWNPAVENQATDRAFRIGQTHNVMVHKFICGGTLEERIDAMIESKTALADEIVTSGETFLTELSNDELHDILRLSEAAVADE